MKSVLRVSVYVNPLLAQTAPLLLSDDAMNKLSSTSELSLGCLDFQRSSLLQRLHFAMSCMTVLACYHDLHLVLNSLSLQSPSALY